MVSSQAASTTQLSVTIPRLPATKWPKKLASRLPSASEAMFIKKEISSIHTSMSHIDEQLPRLKDFICQLTDRRDKLSALFHQDKALIAPVRRIPVEVLAEVFQYCVCWGAEDGCDTFERANMPLVLGHVCTHWRSIAVSTPKLWSNINVSGDPSWKRLCNGRIKPQNTRTSIWVERSGAAPLSIYIPYIERWDGEDDTEVLSQVFKIIAPSSNRWKSLAIEVYEPHAILPYAPMFKNKLSNLRHLALYRRRLRDPEHAWINFFQNVPSLCSLELRSILPVRVKLPWSQLTRFKGHDFPRENCIYILRHCTNLVSCSFLGVNEPLTSYPHHTNLIQHDRLRNLFVNAVGNLLDHFTLPELRSTGIEMPSYNASGDISTFMTTVSRSSCHIQKLALIGLTVGDGEVVIECLRQLPDLVELNLQSDRRGGGVDPSIWQQLTYNKRQDSAVLCPLLHTVWVDVIDGEHKLFQRFVSSRSADAVKNVDEPVPLHTIVLCSWLTVTDKKQRASLEKLRRHGVILRWHSSQDDKIGMDEMEQREGFARDRWTQL